MLQKKEITQTNIFTSIVLFFVLAFFIPIALYIQIEEKFLISKLPIIILWSSILFYCSYRMSEIVRKNMPRFMELFFYIFTYIFLTIVPFTQVSVQKFPWFGYYDDKAVFYSFFIIIIGIISYEIGIFIENKKNYKKNMNVEFIKNKDNKMKFFLDSKKVYFSVIILSLISLVALFLNGYEKLFLTRIENAVNNNLTTTVSNSLIMLNLQKVPVYVAMIIFFVKFKSTLKFKNLNLYIFLVLIALNIVISNPISNARSWFGTIIFSMLLLLVPFQKKTMFYWTIGLLFITLVVFPYADVFRVSLDANIEVESLSSQILNNGDYDAFQQTLNTLLYTDNFGFSNGYQLLGALFFFIPRSIWSDKPIGTGAEVAEQLGYSFTNLSSPFWAEAYINFGILGVFIFLFSYGILSAKIQNNYKIKNNNDSVSLSLILLPFLAPYQMFLLRGDLMNGIAYMTAFLLFSFATYYFSLRRQDNNK